jgi:hypothetical protein
VNCVVGPAAEPPWLDRSCHLGLLKYKVKSLKQLGHVSGVTRKLLDWVS